MASKGYVQSLLNTLPPDIKNVLIPAFDYLAENWRLGDADRASNAQLYKINSTTATVAGTAFSIVHGLGAAPSKLIPVLDLNAVGSQLVPLTVSRAPDARRVYLTSTSTNAVFQCYVEP